MLVPAHACNMCWAALGFPSCISELIICMTSPSQSMICGGLPNGLRQCSAASKLRHSQIPWDVSAPLVPALLSKALTNPLGDQCSLASCSALKGNMARDICHCLQSLQCRMISPHQHMLCRCNTAPTADDCSCVEGSIARMSIAQINLLLFSGHAGITLSTLHKCAQLNG